MRLPPRKILMALSAALLLLITSGIYWMSCRKSAGAAGQAPADTQIARVQTVPIRQGTLTETLTAYGTIVAAPGASRMVSVPFESRVARVMIASGQRVRPGDTLMVIDPSPDTALQIEQAQSAAASAGQTLKRVQERFDLKLATNEQLLAARQSFDQARLHLESLRKRGAGGGRIRADVAGLVSQILAQEGAIVPAGGPLLEIVAGNRLEGRLSVELEDISSVRTGQSVVITHVSVPSLAPVTGSVREVSRSVTQATRLTDVFVALPASTQFLLGEYVAGKIPLTSAQGLIVPRSAVLPSADGHSVYTVQSGRARKYQVTVGLESATEAQVSAAGLRAGMRVVVLGNYVLQDGMAVTEGSPR